MIFQCLELSGMKRQHEMKTNEILLHEQRKGDGRRIA